VASRVSTCYSEALVLSSSTVADNEREDGSLIEEKDGSLTPEITYHGGLGRVAGGADQTKYFARTSLTASLFIYS
jgi:hypothetical protein